jgi:phosphate transport system protein
MENLIDQTHLDAEMRGVKDAVNEMMHLIIKQLLRAHEAVSTFDLGLAEEILRVERRINAMELTVDKEIENTLALYQPVAIDLRFLMATFKINSDVERIGDHAEGIAKYILNVNTQPTAEQLKKLRIHDMFRAVISMLDDVFQAYDEEDSESARKIFKMDKKVNEINSQAAAVVAEFIEQDIKNSVDYLYILSIVRKLERCGDLAKNIAEEIIFYLEAKVLKHKKKK